MATIPGGQEVYTVVDLPSTQQTYLQGIFAAGAAATDGGTTHVNDVTAQGNGLQGGINATPTTNGYDIAYFDYSGATSSAKAATASHTGVMSSELDGVVVKGSVDVSITGNAKGNAIVTDSGDDTVLGGAGDDNVLSGAGDDYVVDGSGDDTLVTGAGNDTVAGGSGDDHIWGEDGADWIWGESGDDFLDGGAGDDVIYGGSGNDTIYGGDGDDMLVGESGDDLIYGGAGDDKMWGGNGTNADGEDTFYFVASESGNDVIYDFETGSDNVTIYNDTGSTMNLASMVSVVNGNLVVTIDSDTHIVLQGVTTFNAADFTIVDA